MPFHHGSTFTAKARKERMERLIAEKPKLEVERLARLEQFKDLISQYEIGPVANRSKGRSGNR